MWYALLPLWWNTWGRAPSRAPWQGKQTLSRGLSSEYSLPWMLPRLDAVPAAVHAVAASARLYNKFFDHRACQRHQTSVCMQIRRFLVAANQANT